MFLPKKSSRRINRSIFLLLMYFNFSSTQYANTGTISFLHKNRNKFLITITTLALTIYSIINYFKSASDNEKKNRPIADDLFKTNSLQENDLEFSEEDLLLNHIDQLNETSSYYQSNMYFIAKNTSIILKQKPPINNDNKAKFLLHSKSKPTEYSNDIDIKGEQLLDLHSKYSCTHPWSHQYAFWQDDQANGINNDWWTITTIKPSPHITLTKQRYSCTTPKNPRPPNLKKYDTVKILTNNLYGTVKRCNINNHYTIQVPNEHVTGGYIYYLIPNDYLSKPSFFENQSNDPAYLQKIPLSGLFEDKKTLL